MNTAEGHTSEGIHGHDRVTLRLVQPAIIVRAGIRVRIPVGDLLCGQKLSLFETFCPRTFFQPD
jgi:hypothetical protein